jgi:hypothetical protein
MEQYPQIRLSRPAYSKGLTVGVPEGRIASSGIQGHHLYLRFFLKINS